MKIKHTEIEIPSEEPFKNCRLDRGKYGVALASIINSNPEGFVLAINNEWGTGKTTFIKMFQLHLSSEGYKTIYFNAWENDFDTDPLVAVMAGLKTLIKVENKTYKSLVEKGSVFAKKIIPTVVKGLSEKYLGTDIIADVAGGISESATEILTKEIEEYSKKKKSLIDFRNLLEGFIKKNCNDKPLIFIIDELDRCKPNYAVEILEQVKHFFSVKGIVFILSIDKLQLGNAIRGAYGCDLINSNEYLRRFIDVEYSLPMPGTDLYCQYLFEYFDFNHFFQSKGRKEYYDLRQDGLRFLNFSIELFKNKKLTLRQQEKIFSHARIVLNTFEVNSYIFPSLFILLIYIRDLHNSFYTELKVGDLSAQQVVDELSKILKEYINDDIINLFIVTEAQLVYFYNKYQKEMYHKKGERLVFEKEGVDTLGIESGFKRYEKADLVMLHELKNAYMNNYGASLKYLLDKIDLIEPMKIVN